MRSHKDFLLCCGKFSRPGRERAGDHFSLYLANVVPKQDGAFTAADFPCVDNGPPAAARRYGPRRA